MTAPMTPTPPPAPVVTISREDFDRIAMIVNDARLKLGNKPIDRMRRPAIEAAWSAICAAREGATACGSSSHDQGQSA